MKSAHVCGLAEVKAATAAFIQRTLARIGNTADQLLMEIKQAALFIQLLCSILDHLGLKEVLPVAIWQLALEEGTCQPEFVCGDWLKSNL